MIQSAREVEEGKRGRTNQRKQETMKPGVREEDLKTRRAGGRKGGYGGMKKEASESRQLTAKGKSAS